MILGQRIRVSALRSGGMGMPHFLLCGVCILGAVSGTVCALLCDFNGIAPPLHEYLMAMGNGGVFSVWLIFADLLRWPFFAALLAVSTLRCIALPVLLLERCFSMCLCGTLFVKLLGVPGALLHVILFIVPALFVLPVMFIIAESTLQTQNKQSAIPALVVAAIFPLLVGCILQAVIVPHFFLALCGHIS